MTRRIINLLMFVPKERRLPVDIIKLNKFAAAYNAYVLELKEGRNDFALWAEVERLWSKL